MDGPAGGRGKWSKAGVPHRGWFCAEVDDLGEPSAVCDMCEASPIRFAHTMRHPDYRGDLVCGAVCAGHMEEDLLRADRRDRRMRNAASRRKAWPNLKGWHLSSRGNLTIRKDRYRVTVFERPAYWSASVTPPGPDAETIFSKRRYTTRLAAQLAAFDLISRDDPAS